MIEVIQLKDCKGSDRYGSCISCGKYADNTFYRLKFYMQYGGTSIVLCSDCFEELTEMLVDIERSHTE